MRSILTETYICYHKQIRVILFDPADRGLYNAVLIISPAPHFILMFRNSKIRIAGICNAFTRSNSSFMRSTEYWQMPGMDSTGCTIFSPSITKSG